MKTALRALLALLSTVNVSVAAETAELKVRGDMVVHPDQLAVFLGIAADKIRASANWDWQSLTFAKPYKTSWSGVQARGPFDIKFSTDGLKRQELSFELLWRDPVINVGRFEIHDTIERDLGGARVIIHLDGACNNMSVRLPAAGWKVRGKLAWGWNGPSLAVQWQDFQFAADSFNAAQVDLGQCDGTQAGLQQALREAIESVSKDQAWMQDVLKDGILDWVQGAFADLQGELLKARSSAVKSGLDLAWEPETLSGLANGMFRVAGHLVLRKASPTKYSEIVERTQTEAQLDLVQESGFVLPKDTLPRLTEFLFKLGELRYRVSSDRVESFQSLMQSRFLQFFVWPDLMNFSKQTKFYFDLSTSKAPSLTNGRMTPAGVAYDMRAPLVVGQWAPTSTHYVPYLDFHSQLSGSVYAGIQGHQLVLRLVPSAMDVTNQFRAEFMRLRSVNTWIATSLLGSRVQEYLSANPLSVNIPQWTLGDGVVLGIKDLQIWKQSLRVPLDFKK